MQGKPHSPSFPALTFPARQQAFAIGKTVFAGKSTRPLPESQQVAVAEENRVSGLIQLRTLDAASQLLSRYEQHFRSR